MVTCEGPDIEFKYRLTSKSGTLLIRDLSLGDCFWIADSGLDFSSELHVLEVLAKLIIKEDYNIGDVSLSEYTSVLKLFANEVLQGKILTPEQVLTSVYFLQGQTFNPNLHEWLTQPVSLIQQMSEIVRKYPKQTL